MPQPLTSLVITTHNREHFLPQALDSILSQTYPYFELILWDDGSTDRSPEIAQIYANQDNRIRAITAKHQGRGYALDSAFSFTQGEYLAIVDSDDWLAPTALEETSQILQQDPDIGMVYTDYIDAKANGTPIGLGQRCRTPYSKDRLLLTFMTFHFRLMRRGPFEQVGGFDPNFAYAPDYDLCLKLSEVTEIVHLKRSLYYYRQHTSAISVQNQWQQIEYSHRAIANAIARRGLEQNLAVGVELRPKYIFKRRTNCKTPGKVFGIGLSKTGTTSLCQALAHLGYRTLHTHQLVDLTAYDAAADTPVALAFRDLDWRYPNSKFILTVRETEDWLISWENHDAKIQQANPQALPNHLKRMRRQAFGQWQFDRDVWRQAYQFHVDDVLSYFNGRDEDLLIFQLCNGEDWKQLCPFLGKSIPAEVFPHQNKAADPLP
ncbi:MAG: sulfotransferase [Cyanobacteria bacterium P01_H01_bin.58]